MGGLGTREATAQQVVRSRFQRTAGSVILSRTAHMTVLAGKRSKPTCLARLDFLTLLLTTTHRALGRLALTLRRSIARYIVRQ